MTINDYKYNYFYNNKNGIWTKENILKEKYNDIYNIIIDYTKENENENENILFVEKVYRFINNIKENPKCKYCNNNVKFKNKIIGYLNTCCNSCSTKLNYKKSQNTLLLNKGVTHPSLLQSNIEKRKDRRINKIKNHINNAQLLSYKNDILEILCDKCNKIHKIEYSIYAQRVQLNLDWRCCITGYMNGKSNGEKDLYKYIKSIYNGIIIENDRKVLNGKELDIYLPELKIAIEYNGLYWHSEIFKDKYYHYNKWLIANNNNIILIQIYEDEWLYKQDIVKSRLRNLLKLNNNRIYARKCDLRIVSNKDSKEFLNNNHLQGSINSSINLGLYYNNELVSIMTFGKPRVNMKYESKSKNRYELYRFCSKLNSNVIGGASKLFHYFINNYMYDEIYSFSANEWPGELYVNIGMTLKSISNYSYWYLNNKDILRFSRHNYTKQKLIKLGYDSNKTEHKILTELGYYKIYGSGNKTFIWIK